jgi:hypothetical protein
LEKYYRGKFCRIRPTLCCQEGYCSQCWIYKELTKLKKTEKYEVNPEEINVN